MVTLLAKAMPAWRRLADTLPGERLLREEGHLVAWGSDGSAQAGRIAWAAADTGSARLHEADAAEQAMPRRLSPTVAGAIRFETTGQIADLSQLASALEDEFQAAGWRLVRGRATLGRQKRRAAVTVDRGEPQSPAALLVTAGVHSGLLLAPFGHQAPLIAERGYHIRTADHDWPADLPPVVFEDRSMIATRYRHCVQAASFVELGHPHGPPDPQQVGAAGAAFRGTRPAHALTFSTLDGRSPDLSPITCRQSAGAIAPTTSSTRSTTNILG